MKNFNLILAAAALVSLSACDNNDPPQDVTVTVPADESPVIRDEVPPCTSRDPADCKNVRVP